MFMGIFFFRLGKFSSIILLKLFTDPLCWKLHSLLYYPQVWSSHFVLDFWDVLVQELFAFCIFFVVSTFSMVSSAPEILSSISCILLVMLTPMAPDLFLGFLTSGLSLWFLYCFYFQFQIVDGFVHFLCLFVFFCNSLREFVFPLLGLLPLHLCSVFFLRELFMSFLKSSIIMRSDF